MKLYLESLDKQILEGVKIGESFIGAVPARVQRILFCGMGGSAISGDVVRILLSETSRLSFKVSRADQLPAWVDDKTLVICSSYSGNAREILGALDQALRLKSPVLVISAGGKLGQTAEKKKLPYLKIPGGMMPRFSIAYTTFALLAVFKQWRWFTYSEKDIKEVIAVIKKISPQTSLKIAKALHRKMPHFYGYTGYAGPVLTRWRAQLAENAKMLSSHYLLPEMFHNEIEGWNHPQDLIKQSTAVFFTDLADPDWVFKKIRAVEKIIKSRGGHVLEIASQGKSLMARMFSLLALGDWVSYQLAQLNEVDPVEIPTIEGLKKIK